MSAFDQEENEAIILDGIYPIASVPENTDVLVRPRTHDQWARAHLFTGGRRPRWVFDGCRDGFVPFLPHVWKMLP